MHGGVGHRAHKTAGADVPPLEPLSWHWRRAEFCSQQITYEHRAAVRHDARAEFARINFRELRTEKKDARRIVNPHEHDQHRAGRAEARCHAAGAEVEADQKLPEGE